MSWDEFRELRARLEQASQRPDLDIAEESELARHLKPMLARAAAWAARLGLRHHWYQADFATLIAPDAAPAPENEIAATVALFPKRAVVDFTPRYVSLLLRWTYVPRERREAAGLLAPYEPLLPILDARAMIGGEHGFMSVGLASIWIGSPERHLGDDLPTPNGAADKALNLP